MRCPIETGGCVYFKTGVETVTLWYVTVVLLALALIIVLVTILTARKQIVQRVSAADRLVAKAYGRIRGEISKLGESIAHVSWTRNSDQHINRMLEKMVEILDEQDTVGLDILTIFNKIDPSAELPYSDYYSKIEEKLLDSSFGFYYRRAVIFRREPLGYHLARREPFWLHMRRVSEESLDGAKAEFRFFGATQRLFDVAFALFYKTGSSPFCVEVGSPSRVA